MYNYISSFAQIPVEQGTLPELVEGLLFATTQSNDTQDQTITNLDLISSTLQRLHDDCGVQNVLVCVQSFSLLLEPKCTTMTNIYAVCRYL